MLRPAERAACVRTCWRSARELGRGLSDASRGGIDEMPKDLSLNRIRGCRVFGMPLHAEIPACMILQCHRLDNTVSRVRRRSETGAERGDALVVVTGDGSPTSDDLAQW